jgi:prolyl oligopeptidase
LDSFYYSLKGFLNPASHNRYQAGRTETFFKPKLGIDANDYNSELVWYTSKDGTRVSMLLFSKRSVKVSRNTPVTITGYGGFGVPSNRGYQPDFVAWLENGGVIAIPHLRGGGEYGEKWHRAGSRESKQNVFDDFISATEWLIEKGIGSQRTISTYGASNGGLLVGAALVQRPDLFAAVSCDVPVLDMIRYTNFYNAESWTTEYGDPSVKEDFEWLFRYSPYHHVENVKYPAVLLSAAMGDTRVDPMHAFKMAAKLQGKSKAFEKSRPILLYVQCQGGHVGSSLENDIDFRAKSFVFRAHHTGLKIKEESS